MILIRKKLPLDECPACGGKEFKDVSWSEYPNMYECLSCGKVTQVKADLVDIEE